ncbi:MAG TPA: uracil-DNA glycosylase, partial [Dissulfurispiraceae bacterium]|nr:uracil-DNA glycosylase [Dissulfurispiraceae bacterium]
ITGAKDALMTALRGEIGDCTRCKLSGGRTQIVFGEGSLDARLMFVGEAPGREEDLQGRPFVGEAGKILTSLITRMGEGIGFSRQDVYIANIVKCRPPMNRDPEPDEIATCLPFLNRQIEIISPDVIVCLGRVSTHTLLGIRGPLGKLSITKVRGKFYDYSVGGKTIPLMPTFHPAYLLRNPKDKWLTWEDAQAVLKKLDEIEEGR